MNTPSSNGLNRFLERRGLWLSNNATLTLVTLIVFLGITAGFIYALMRIDAERQRAGGGPSTTTRGASALLASCAHAAVDFDPAATMADIRQVMRAAEGFVTYGPDEFGRFQVRLVDGAQGVGVQTLRATPAVASVRTYPECQ
jgi:hypothetical protein